MSASSTLQFMRDWWGVGIAAIPTYLVIKSGVLTAARNRQLSREENRNDQFAAPQDSQVRWHIRHMRQDLMLLCGLVHDLEYLALVGVWVLVGIWLEVKH